MTAQPVAGTEAVTGRAPASSIKDLKWTAHMMAISLGLSVPMILFGKAVGGALFVVMSVLVLVAPGREATFRALASLHKRPLVWVLLALFAVWAVSVAGSIDPMKSAQVWLRMIAFLTLAAAIWARMMCEPALLDRTLTVLVLASVATGVAALIGIFLLPEQIAALGLKLPKYYASAVACLVPLVVWAGFRAGGRMRLLAIAYPALAVGAIAGMSSRSAVAGLAFSALAMGLAWGARNVSRRTALLLMVAAIAAACIVLAFIFVNLPPLPYQPDSEPFIPSALIDKHRQVIWSFTLNLVGQAPLFGHGLDVINEVTGAGQRIVGIGSEYIPSHPHNWILEVLVETGVVGLSLMAIALTFAAYGVLSNLRAGMPGALAALGVFAAFWSASLFNFSIWSAWWQVSFLVLYAIGLAGKQQRSGPGLVGG